ncbi:MAG TPA: hypothetical protein VHP30_08505, partial [Ignavibacteriales bacterium]|nr:hypothetical protein [Ignavibacteriales bacterium]
IKNSGPWDFFFNLMSIFILGFISSFALYYTSQKEGYEDWQKKIALFPLFMAGSMGFALNNSRAVVEGLLSRKSEFVRTPKFKLMTKGDTWANTAYTKKEEGRYFRLCRNSSCGILLHWSYRFYILYGICRFAVPAAFLYGIRFRSRIIN